ncbi:hypothetical protein HXX76_000825 [Chlamydomonas incerta]|uniref:Asparagine synthetase domain-containing protein n=1 Tax=Chlamydomonas incerta TaxID=51695 RepID=A0A835WF17_CHLIN|nr:hypothetical protein HXX76_000825 [Chlamydomonas incerta]|eukprot:KAG2446233.1 hypothetical protein HXX76_000825 [Chlamydomonas incerta]
MVQVGGRELGLSAAFTVICSDEATDLQYAAASAAASGLTHHLIRISLPDLLRRYLPLVVRAIKSFDPMSLRNDVAIACALSEAAARGYRCAATGDGADELLGGYGFTHGLEPAAWARQRDHMATVMRFGSTTLGQHLGLAVASPFTRPGVVAAAQALGKEDCVAASDAGEGLQGKMPLRQLFPHVSSARRRKDPIEVGCGTTALSRPGYFDSLISDSDFEAGVAAAAAEGVALRDKEHLSYYRVFREVFPGGQVPGLPRHGSDPCPKCGYQFSTRTQTFCVTCGHYDPALRTRHDKPAGASKAVAA